MWYLVQSKANSNHIAKRNLERQGFVVFQPLEKRTLARRGKFSTQLRPFIAGYLFVSYFAAAAPWSAIDSTYGVSRLVKFGERPAIVPDKIIRDLEEACDKDGVLSPPASISQGDRIEVTSGPLANFVGQVERLAPNHRAMVLIDFMGKQTRMETDLSNIQIVSSDSDQLKRRTCGKTNGN